MLVHTKTYTSPPLSSYIYHHNASKKTWVGAGGVDVVCAGRFLYPVFIYSHTLRENCTTLFNRTRYQARPLSRLDYIVMVTHRLYPVKNTSGMFLSGLAVPVCTGMYSQHPGKFGYMGRMRIRPYVLLLPCLPWIG